MDPPEMILREEDADEWVYKGEGAANLVLSYCGSSPSLVGKVMRIQKVEKTKSLSMKGESVISSYEKLVWAHIDELVQSSSKSMASRAFVTHVMRNLLGSKHVDVGVTVKVSQEFLKAVERNIHSQRPPWRVDASQIDYEYEYALLISDHSVFTGIGNPEFSVAIEIKPKCGFLPSSDFIAKTNAVKKHATRFKMHQILKKHQGEISSVSEYDPLDLFSRSKLKIKHALLALFSTPQNNLRIFLNGSLLFGGLGGGFGNTAIQSYNAEEAIEVLRNTTGLSLSSLVDLTAEAIHMSGMLDRLLAIQQMDTLDIEGAIHAYYNIISQPCLVCERLTDGDLLHKYSFLHSLSIEESLKIVREYLIAATAKDCSLMVCFRPRDETNSSIDCDSIILESSNQIFDYKAYFIDLDLKPLDKMVYYHKLDKKIVTFYLENEEVEGQSLNAEDGHDSKIIECKTSGDSTGY